MKNLKFLVTTFLLTTLAIGNAWADYTYTGTGTFNKQSAVDGNGYYVFILTQGALTNSASSDYIAPNTTYVGSDSSLTDLPNTIVLQVTGYTNGKYYIQNNSGNYLYSSANKKITYSSTSQYWTTGDNKLKTTEGTVVYMGYVNSKYRPYSASSTNPTSFVCVYKLATSSCSAPTSPSISGTADYTAGDNISLTASASGTSASTTYAWYKGDPASDGTLVQAASTSGATYTKNSCVVGDAATYYCVISNGTGCDVTVNKAITVSAACTAISPTLSYTSTSLTVGGTSSDPTITGNTGSGAVTYSSSNTSVATVNASGVVTAVAAGNATITASIATNGGYCSGSATANFTVSIPTYTVSWLVNGSSASGSPSTLVEAGSKVTALPTDPTSSNCDGSKVFVGWTATQNYSNASDAPTDLFTTAAGSPTIDANTTFYAVFANAAIGTDYTQITATNALEAGGRYLIVGNSSSTYKALPVDKAETLTAVTPSSSKISNPAAELIWTLEGSAGTWKIKSVSNGKYLQISSGNLTFESSTSLTFNASVSSSKFTFTSSATSGNKILSYYASGNRFNAYTTANNVYLYKANVTYSNYATVCCTNGAVITLTPDESTINLSSTGTAATTITFGQTDNDGGTWGEPSVDGSAIVEKTDGSHISFVADEPGTYHVSITYTKDDCPKIGTTTITVTATPIITLVQVGDVELSAMCGGTDTKTVTLNAYNCGSNNVTLSLSNAVSDKFWVTPASITPTDGKVVDETITLHYTASAGESADNRSGVLSATCNSTSSANSISVNASKNGCVPYTITFINNGSPVASVGGFGGENITAHDPYTDFEEFGLEENPVFTTCADYEFVGWTTEANKTGVSGTTTIPTLEIAKGASKTYNSISENVTLYALWKVTEGGGGSGFVQVESDPGDWSGTYLLASGSRIWTGVDANQCYVSATISSNTIADVPSGAATLTIASMTGGYSIQINGGTNDGKYIGRSSDSNGMNLSSSALINTLSMDGSNVTIAGQYCTMRYNNSADQYRFRYYKSGQTAVQLYKENAGTTTYYTNPVCDPKVSVVELCDASVSAVNMVAPVSGTAKATYTAYATNIENATQLKYSITGTDRALFSLDWGSTYPTLSNGAAQQQFTITYAPVTTADASATLQFFVEDGENTHSCNITLSGSTCTPLSLSATSTTNSFTINSTTNFGATDTLFIYNGVSVEPGGCGVYPFDSIYCKDCASKGGKYHDLPQGVSSLTINGGAARPVAKGTTYSYYSKHATCQSGVKNITTQMPANVPTISVDHNFWEAIATKGETVTDVVEVTVTNYSGPISFDISGEGASMYSITSLGAGKYRITYTPTNTDPNPATANFHFTEDCTDYRATVALSGMTPSVTVVEVQSNGFTMQTDVEGEPRIMLSYESQEGSGAEKVAEDLFFSKYYEATGNTKLLGIFNGTKDTISLANYSVSVGATNRKSPYAGSWSSTTSLSTYGKLAPNQELILWYTQNSNDDNQITNCVTEKGTFSYPAETKNSAITWSGRQSIKLSKNGTPIDLIGAVNTAGSSGIPVAGNCDPDWGDIKDGNAIDRAWCALGTSIEDPSNKAYEISTNRCLLIRLNDVVSGADAAANNVGDFTTLGTEWAGRRVEMTAGDEKGIQSSCEGFDYVAGFDYNDYYTQFNPIREDGVNVVKTALIDGGWTATFDPEKVGAFTTYSCKNLKIDINYIQHDGRTLSRDEQEELVEEGEEDFDTVTVASTVYKVPIIVTGNKTTDDEIFHDYSVDTCRSCDVAILSGAVLTKVSHSNNERDSIRDFYVYAGGQFVTDGSHGTYHINALSMRSDKDEVSSAWLAGDLKTSTKKVYHDKLIDNSKSYFFCLPFNCKVSEIKQMNGSTLGTYDEAWGIATYDGASRVTEEGLCADGRNWKTVPYGSTLEAGKGYIIKINSKYPRYVRFPMTLPSESYNESSAAAKEVSIQQYGVDAATNGDIGWNNVGWNLVGNPYLTYFKSGTASSTSGVNNGTLEVAGHYQRKDGGTGKNTWEFVEQTPTEIYVTYPADDAGSTYNQSLASNEVLNPFRSFFVQAKANGTLTYAIAKRQQGSSAPMRLTYAAEQRPKIMLTLTAENDGLYDETTLLIGDEYTDEYELGSDLAKWMVAQQVRPQLASVGAGTKLAFNALPNSENINVPLYMLFPKAGNYAIAVNEKQSELDDIEHIYLLYNGDIVADLKSGVQHTHIASKYSASSKYAVRIERKEQEITTPIDQYASDWTPMAITNQRVVRLEQLPMMDAEVSIYDVTGKQMLSTSSNGQQTMQFTMPASGFYTIVVNTIDDQFTFKTVVK